MVHVACNASSYQARKSSRDQRARVQSGSPESQFLTSIPSTQEVQTTRLNKSVRVLEINELRLKTYKVGSLNETKEETNNDQPGKTLSSGRSSRNDTPDDHSNGKIDGRLSGLVEQQIRRDLHNYVPNKQDGYDGL